MGYPEAAADEREAMIGWLDFLRSSVLGKLDGLDERQARWTPEGRLTSILGIVNHLTHVEWRWIDGAFGGAETSRSDDEFRPSENVAVEQVVEKYRDRARATNEVLRSVESLGTACTHPMAEGRALDLRWVALHLIEETARHAGHADATRELLDGTTGL
jgi:uncharacterized damage-inducible protein DinB